MHRVRFRERSFCIKNYFIEKKVEWYEPIGVLVFFQILFTALCTFQGVLIINA